jgi:O-antigen ligase
VLLVAAMVAQGYAISHSYLWAAPLLALLLVALAPDLPVVPMVAVGLVVRVLTSEALSSRRAQYSTSLNLSAAIAVLFILLAVGLLLRRRRHAGLAAAAGGWLCFFTAVAVGTHGGVALTYREGLREASIVAVAVIVWNAAGALTVHRAVRIVQLAGAGAALLALYQLATHTGLNIEGQIRSNGTFTHPNGAAVYFAIAVAASLWSYMDHGRRPIDAMLVLLFAAATISTFSIGGLASLLVMLVAYGLTRPTATRVKVASCFLGLLMIAAFAATPLGAKRLENESATSLASAQTRGAANTSLAWRFYKWRTLLPLWEKAPLLGQGLGSTVTAEATAENETAGKVPHNEYVRYLVETGALGLASLLAALALLFRALWRVKSRAPNNIVSLGLGVVAGCALNGFGDNTLLYSTTGYAAALIVAAVLVAARAPTHSSS